MDYLDHKFLNEVEPFDKINPSAENIAYFIFKKLEEELKKDYSHLDVFRVDIWESHKSCASYLNSNIVGAVNV